MTNREKVNWLTVLVIFWAPSILVITIMGFAQHGVNFAQGVGPIAWLIVIGTLLYLFALLLRAVYISGKNS